MQVACLLVADFLIAIARRGDRRLRGRPIVIGGAPEEHAQVRACSREAARAGVTIGTTLRKALSLCPDAVFLPYREREAQQEAAAIEALVEGQSPVREVVANGHIHFETRGLAQLFGLSEEAWLAEVQEMIAGQTGLPVTIAGAEAVFVAHAGAVTFAEMQPEGGSIVIPGQGTRSFLAHLPVEVLPVEPLMHQRLRKFGLECLGQVAELPFSAMQAQFGKPGARAWELANGQDSDQLVAKREEVRLVEETDLPAPAATLEPIVVGTRSLLQRALARPEVRGHSLRRLDWRLSLESGEVLDRRVVFREPTSDPARMLYALQGKIERLQLPAAALGIGITLSGLCSEYGHQGNLWPRGPKRQKELEDAIHQLNAREGGPQVYRVVDVQPWSRIPERQRGLVAFEG
jgi:nucleotidyltransferase/DNA polymerase involved in DNA repair